MNHLNTTIIQGNLVKDPDFKELQNTNLCKFSIASTRKYKDKEDVCFVDVVVWGNLASLCDKYLSKGRPVLVNGRLNLEMWESKDGSKRSRHNIIADKVIFLHSKNDKDNSNNNGSGNNIIIGNNNKVSDNTDKTFDDLPF